MTARTHSIAVIPGDGIGPEVIDAALVVLDALAHSHGPNLHFEQYPAGLSAWLECGDSLPASTLEAAKSSDAVLLGAIDAASLPHNSKPALRHLRKDLQIYASVRPVKSLPGVPIPARPIDVVIVREVTQGFYSGLEKREDSNKAHGTRLITREATQRVADLAFRLASTRSAKVTAVHKVGSLKITDGLFLETVEGVANNYPSIEFNTENVDACALKLVTDPEPYDVLLCTNAFGDILSDLAAGLAGGLGLAPSACVGSNWSYFEPVHGTAPDIAGKGLANPGAAILAAALMLDYLGEHEAAKRIRHALLDTVSGRGIRTRDIGGTASCLEFAQAVASAVESQAKGTIFGSVEIPPLPRLLDT